jgi:hypothetical protein
MFNENAAGIILFVLFFLLRYKCKAFWLVDFIFFNVFIYKSSSGFDLYGGA